MRRTDGSAEASDPPLDDRGQASLPPVAIALVILTGVALVSLTLANGALAAADRTPEERRTAVSLSERAVAADSPLTVRENVLNRTRVEALDAADLRQSFPVAEESDVAMSLGGERVLATDADVRGTTVERLVLVAESGDRTLEPRVNRSGLAAIPRRTDRATLTLSPGNVTVDTVRANDRVVLHDDAGLEGTYDLSLSRRETTALRFNASGPLPDGSVEIRVPTEDTSKATLAVTVDG